MCGIVGYIGTQQACPILIEGLKKLEYRGYDSAGVALLNGGNIEIVKSVGRLHDLEKKLNGYSPWGSIGIGHTRWATHGRPSDVNSHPHKACSSDFAVVHNGIIENYLQLKGWLASEGHIFCSETDTEVLAHLVENFYQGDLLEAVRKAISKVEGSYAMAVMTDQEEDKIVCVRKESPLVIGLGKGEQFIASDIPAILNHTRKTYIMDDHEIAVVENEDVSIFNGTGKKINKSVFNVNWDQQAAEKDGFDHFMLKEIYEQPPAIKETLKGRLDIENYRIQLNDITLEAEYLKNLSKINIVACGTAYHAGLVGKHVIEKLTRIPVEVELASEYRYRDPIVDPERNLVMVVSQSGETADTLAAMKLSKSMGAKVLAVTNVVGSSVSREADSVIYTWAGPEIAVASTKAYITQLVAMYLWGLYIAQLKESLSQKETKEIMDGLRCIPSQVQCILEQTSKIEDIARVVYQKDDLFFIGRGLDYAVAQEGSLKLKEISYIHAESYAAGELKHGTLALVTEDTPVLAVLTQKNIYEKTLSNIKEVKARDAYVIAVTLKSNKSIETEVDKVFYVPENLDILMPLLTVVPLQLLSYYAALMRGCDVDKPRNLAKSVTVE
ncbi:glutamine--fructose-6-phosphate transaminase (isomerizing) [Candidatus Contubernalis alkaliaceticus]|uniref:glutamine--fructose-6-phosphate transaminase (isomerizing) n=1 Tax=Candidatus Contubernalis alkaliaceticus TaxID=338645 RepID=UPI001F4C0956|nr:glutamine--fructose-6-phosphate transaminase (isomerizing) [Candidatus Contubernalis alkalaceticus]UNC90980.1 glutamine--fructose-6-phosphate transaminase (isomerizing) [Candidatus Contubernalis alkalaceticus]